MNKIAVVPSCRADQMQGFREAWPGVSDWDQLIVVEDGPERTFGDYSWREIDADLGRDSWIISRRDSAIRSYGFLKAVEAGATHILTLDDDCRPEDGCSIFQGHIRSMASRERWVSTLPDLRPRGIPYRNKGYMDVMVNMGLWTNVPDQDAIGQLSDPRHGYKPPGGRWIVPGGQYLPTCGMNLCFKREVASLFYFPLMGEGQPYRRFDDIWAGIIAKRVMDHLRLGFSVGEPFVFHERASDPFANLVKEAPGVGANETFWEIIDRINLTSTTPDGCVQDIAEALSHNPDPYMAKLGKALHIWVELVLKASGSR